jgi:hypothetical protein
VAIDLSDRIWEKLQKKKKFNDLKDFYVTVCITISLSTAKYVNVDKCFKLDGYFYF